MAHWSPAQHDDAHAQGRPGDTMEHSDGVIYVCVGRNTAGQTDWRQIAPADSSHAI